jgi:valyl-tRNA synthetase
MFFCLLVCPPIFYVNAAPHGGHLYTLFLTDILKRLQKLRGDDRAVSLTGTDEHCMKIQKAASKAKVDVKALCDQHASEFEDLARFANVTTTASCGRPIRIIKPQSNTSGENSTATVTSTSQGTRAGIWLATRHSTQSPRCILCLNPQADAR